MDSKSTAKLNIDKSLDKLDLQIIQAMMLDAEVSYADLGKQFFVSGGTIHVRIKKLEELGIVQGKRLAVDLKSLGYVLIFKSMAGCVETVFGCFQRRFFPFQTVSPL